MTLFFEFVWLLVSTALKVIIFVITYVPILELFMGFIAFVCAVPWSVTVLYRNALSLGVYLTSIFAGFVTYHVGFPYAPYYVVGGVIASFYPVVFITRDWILERQDDGREHYSQEQADEASAPEPPSQTEQMYARIRELERELKAQKAGENDPYKILGVKSSATLDEVIKAHRKLVRKYHPDLASTTTDEIQRLAEERLRQINDALDRIKARS